MGIKEEKVLLRRDCVAVRDGIDPAERKARDERIAVLCQSLAVFRFAEKVLCYHPIRSEANLCTVMEAALAMGKELYLPLVKKGEEGKMSFHRILSFDDLEKGSFGVMEPSSALPVWKEDGRSAVCFIPALAYAKDGYRLGYGKGYYDRFLSAFSGSKVGVTYSELFLECVPHNRFDCRADLVVTEKGVNITREI